MHKELFYEDLAVGQVFQSPRSISVSSEDIKSFAQQFDPQPFHLDEAEGSKSFFGGLVASGWHTGALTMRLIVETFPFAGGTIGAGGESLRWPKPVRPGDKLSLSGEILGYRLSNSKPNLGLVRCQLITQNQNAETVQEMIVTMLAFRRAVKDIPTKEE